MDELKKEQIICAIYIAICNRNYRCAKTILDDAMDEAVNEKIDRIIETLEHDKITEGQIKN